MGFGTRTLEVSGMWNKDPLNLKLSHNKDEKKQTNKGTTTRTRTLCYRMPTGVFTRPQVGVSH